MRLLLWPLSLLFAVVARMRVALYQIGFLPSRKVSCPVVSLGNLTTGGTGKTPWVHRLSQELSEKVGEVAVLSRGYSGDFDGVLQVNDGMDPRKCGDEPLWLKVNSRAQVYVGRSRLKAAELAMQVKAPKVFILDDGFQHLKLKRDVNIVLIDASAPRWHYRMLPVGRMREGFSALQRTDWVIINKCNFADEAYISWLADKVLAQVSYDRLLYADFVFKEWQPLVDGLHSELPVQQVSMTCGLGNPDSFMTSLGQLGIEPVKKFIFPDHYFWQPRDVERIAYNMQQVQSFDLVMTEKDAVKLNRYKKHFFEMGIQMWVCKMQVKVKKGEEGFLNSLVHDLGGVQE